ncbi:hypothetical protein [Gluconacetobacter entanii]|nr:hypothetical protein [Gluconacetobacter entanii]MCE2579257.1 hypothetical protein [Komagataeibacter sp. FNDCR1]
MEPIPEGRSKLMGAIPAQTANAKREMLLEGALFLDCVNLAAASMP